MHRLIALYCAVLVAATTSAAPGGPRQKTTHLLRPRRTPGALDRVQLALEVGGQQKIVDQGKVKRFKISVLANLTYDEKSLEAPASSPDPLRSIRYYERAAAVIQVQEERIKPALRDGRRLISAETDGRTATLFSPHGPLTRDELDLIDVLGNSLLLDYLLPEKPVAVGDTWEHSAELMAALLGLDAVSETDVNSALSAVADGSADLEMGGRIEGAVGGVSTQIELKARYRFDLSTKRVTWFGLAVREDRSVGHIGPGLEVIARLQMKISPLEESAQLSDTALAGLTLKPTAELTQLEYESPNGGWEISHDRRWFITQDEQNLAILRLIDRGEFVAQCKVHALATSAAGKGTTLAEFQDDIKHGLGESFKQFVEAGQRSTEAGYRVCRAVVAGEVADLPIQWTYYLVADKDGHQVVLAFTVEGSLIDRFAGADQELLKTFHLGQPEVASKPPDAERQNVSRR